MKDDHNNSFNDEFFLKTEEIKLNFKKAKSNKAYIFFVIFNSLIFLAIIAFIVFKTYHYNILKSKPPFLANYIVSSSNNRNNKNLFKKDDSYIFKGNAKNNYLLFNNILWRIVKIENDGSIRIVTNDYINVLPWNNNVSEYDKASINKYLNDYFYKNLNSSLLVKNEFCNDKLDDLNYMQCEENNINNYITLLSVDDFLNSIDNDSSYLINEEEKIWLVNNSENKIWHTNGLNLSLSDAKSFYEIRPSVKLKSKLSYLVGDGTVNNPYILENNISFGVGSKIKLDNDIWYVYDINNNIKLVLDKNLDASYTGESLNNYLNTTYYESLSYKELIIKDTWYVGKYNQNFEDVYTNSIEAYIGIPNLLDIKFNNEFGNYFMSTTINDYIMIYDKNILYGDYKTKHEIRPCITLDKNIIDKLVFKNNVYELE